MNRPSAKAATGTFYGVGVGPGDPELLTLKAQRVIRDCGLVTYLKSSGGKAMARDIAGPSLREPANPRRREHAIIMPMCESREVANRVYDEAAAVIAEALDGGLDVAFLCQGDPFLFGSFAYLHDRLAERYHTEVVPGVNSIAAGAALIGRPLGLLAENIAIISGRHNDQDILRTLGEFDNVAIMKPGRRRAQLLRLIEQAGRSADAAYVEHAGQAGQRIVHDVRRLDARAGPYFSLLLVTRQRDYSTGHGPGE